MSKYTTQLRWIVEQMSQGIPEPDDHRYPNAVYKYIGLDKYPIFDEDYRYTLNDKIIDHFYFREIGFETAKQFAWYLRRTMNEIMPKYNMLYSAMENVVPEELFITKTNKHEESWDKDETTDEGINRTLEKTGTDTTIHDGTVESQNSGTIENEYNGTIESQNSGTIESQNSGTIESQNSGTISDAGTTSNSVDSTVDVIGEEHNRNVFQDTPMSLLSNVGSPSIEDLDYATNVTYDDNTNETNTTSNEEQSGTSSNVRTLADKNVKTLGDKNVKTLGDKNVKTLENTNVETLGDKNVKTFDNSDTLEHDTLDTENTDRDKAVNDKGWRVWTDFGRDRSLSELSQEFIDKWVNIDMAIINDLEDLFMGVW